MLRANQEDLKGRGPCSSWAAIYGKSVVRNSVPDLGETRSGFRVTLPSFPAMSPMSALGREDLGDLLADLRPYSDYMFGSLRYWNTGDRLRLAESHGSLVVRFNDYLTGEEFFGVAGTSGVVKAAEEVIATTGVTSLRLLPAETAELLSASGWVLSADHDQDDYVLDLDAWCPLDGRNQRDRRRRSRRFQRTYSKSRYRVARANNWAEARSAVELVVKEWTAANPSKTRYAFEELTAISRMLDLGDSDCDLAIDILWVDELPALFAATEVLGGGWGVYHFGKAAGWAADAEAYAEVEILNQLRVEGGVRWLNLEQDLGLKGLRKHKEKLGPSMMLRKFTATPPGFGQK
jgi:hypothetical protein